MFSQSLVLSPLSTSHQIVLFLSGCTYVHVKHTNVFICVHVALHTHVQILECIVM